MTDPGFPRHGAVGGGGWGAPTLAFGAKTYYLAGFCQKQNENEKNCTGKTGKGLRAPGSANVDQRCSNEAMCILMEL